MHTYVHPYTQKHTPKCTAVQIVSVVVLSLMFALPAKADLKLATSKNCVACHAVDKKLVGPSYKDVAKKYAGQAGAADKLAVKIVKGGGGVWGVIPMPANEQVSASDAKTLANWILSLK